MRKPRRVETKLAEHAEGERERYFSRARDLLFLGLISFRVERVVGRLRGARCLDPGDSVIATPGRIRLRESNFGEWQLASGQRRLTAEKRRPPSPGGAQPTLFYSGNPWRGCLDRTGFPFVASGGNYPPGRRGISIPFTGERIGNRNRGIDCPRAASALLAPSRNSSPTVLLPFVTCFPRDRRPGFPQGKLLRNPSARSDGDSEIAGSDTRNRHPVRAPRQNRARARARERSTYRITRVCAAITTARSCESADKPFDYREQAAVVVQPEPTLYVCGSIIRRALTEGGGGRWGTDNNRSQKNRCLRDAYGESRAIARQGADRDKRRQGRAIEHRRREINRSRERVLVRGARVTERSV